MPLLSFSSSKVFLHPFRSELSPRRASSSYRPLHAAASPNIPARDRVIDFGKHRGRMLGSLPSSYLSWISKNLRARDFLHWANLADQVLSDPVYRDRLEWESAERLLAGCRWKSDAPVADFLSMSETFGWDNDDKEGWARVDFDFVGTSMSGRIPRRLLKVGECSVSGRKVGVVRVEERREKRRERRMMQMEKLRREVGNFGSGDALFLREKNDLGDQDLRRFGNPFPGRGSILEKIKRR